MRIDQNHYVHNLERLVIVYDFLYDEEKNDYDAKFQEFMSNAGITSDKIARVVPVSEGHEKIHVFADGDIEPLALVEFRVDEESAGKYDFKNGQLFVYMGEIPNMPGHCVVADYLTGKVSCGYHIDNFTVKNDV